MKPEPPAEPRDDGLEWLREIRRRISSDFDHDQQRLGDYLRERERELGARIVRTQDRVVAAKP